MIRSVANDLKAATLVESALVMSILLPMLLGGMEIGLMMWSKGTLQSVAALTARCYALGYAPCATTTAAQSYATGTLIPNFLGTEWTPKVVVTVSDQTSCNSVNGSFKYVVITTSNWVGTVFYPSSIDGATQKVTACFPV